MSTIKSPQEKKDLSLERERRNTYGENPAASRKGIRRGKQRSHMEERRAVSLILGRLRDRVDEDHAMEADVLAKTTVTKKGRTAFKKTPDEPLGIVMKRKLEKRQELAESRSIAVDSDGPKLYAEGGFDIPYVRASHKRFIIAHLRIWVNARHWGSNKKKPAYVQENIAKEAARWKEAILRDAPLLKGFFAEEPQWRERMLRWCEETWSSAHK